MFNKIAVVLRGHVRTWFSLKNIVFKNFKTLAKEVDYYFVTWDIYDNYFKTKIISSFETENLSLLKFVKPNSYYNGAQGPSWLTNHTKTIIQNQNYDFIFETRPDVVIKIDKSKKFVHQENIIFTCWESEVIDGNGVKDIGICDAFQGLGLKGFRAYCNRYKMLTKINNHVDLRNFYKQNSINIKLFQDFIKSDIVRPTQVNLLLEEHARNFWVDKWHEWDRFSSYEKINILNFLKINLEDYNLKI